MLSQEHQLFHGTSEENLKSGVVSCFACSVRQEALQPVPFEGQFSKFLLLGRNPGREENETGRPFVGRAGQMVNEDYLPLMGLSRKEVIISNILKCHTYKNRVPLPSEVYFCRDMWLKQEILFFRPKVIFLLGNDCVRGIFGPKFPSVTDYHASVHEVDIWGVNILIIPLLHPGYLLRNNSIANREMVFRKIVLLKDKIEEIKNG